MRTKRRPRDLWPLTDETGRFASGEVEGRRVAEGVESAGRERVLAAAGAGEIVALVDDARGDPESLGRRGPLGDRRHLAVARER